MSSVIVSKKAIRELVNEILDNKMLGAVILPEADEKVIEPNPVIGSPPATPENVEQLRATFAELTKGLTGEEVGDVAASINDMFSDDDTKDTNDAKGKKGNKMSNVEESIRRVIRKLVREAYVTDSKGRVFWVDPVTGKKVPGSEGPVKDPGSYELPPVTKLPPGSSTNLPANIEKTKRQLQDLLGGKGRKGKALADELTADVDADEVPMGSADAPVPPKQKDEPAKKKTSKRERPSAIRSKIDAQLAAAQLGQADPDVIAGLMIQLKGMEHIVDETLPDEDAQLYFSLYRTAHNFMMNRFELEDDDDDTPEATEEEEKILYTSVPKDNTVFDTLFTKVLTQSSPVVASKAKPSKGKRTELDELIDELYGYWVAKREELGKPTKFKGAYLLDDRLAQNHREFLLAVGRALLENAASGTSFTVADDDGSKLKELAVAFELSVAGAKAMAEQTLARWALEQKSDL